MCIGRFGALPGPLVWAERQYIPAAGSWPMYLEVNEQVEVWARFGVNRPRIVRWFFRWKGRLFEVQEVTFYHTDWQGEALVHHLAVTAAVVTGSIKPNGNGSRQRPARSLRVFELAFNAKSLTWTLVKYYEPE